jgi:N-methylhydantoinase A
VSARLNSRGLVEKTRPERMKARVREGTTSKPPRRADVFFEDGRRRVGVYAREDLPAGARLQSPCVVTEYSSTTLVPEGARASVDAGGNLVIEL